MSPVAFVGVLCVVVAPALGDPVTYTFDVISGSISLDATPGGLITPDPVTVGQDGTFCLTVYQSDGHIGESDTLVLSDCDVYNTELLEVHLQNMLTVHVYPGSAHILDFAPAAAGHLGPGGQASVSTDVYVDAFVIITGLMDSWLMTRSWAGEASDWTVTLTTSASQSDTLQASLHGTFGYEYGSTGIGETLTFDLTLDIVGTVHMVPDPALGGLTALGLSLSGVWLRRRTQKGLI